MLDDGLEAAPRLGIADDAPVAGGVIEMEVASRGGVGVAVLLQDRSERFGANEAITTEDKDFGAAGPGVEDRFGGKDGVAGAKLLILDGELSIRLIGEGFADQFLLVAHNGDDPAAACGTARIDHNAPWASTH